MLYCGKFGHQIYDCPESEKFNQVVDSASLSSVSDEELDLVLCVMDDIIIEQLYEESISLAKEVAAGIQNKHLVK